MHGKRSLRGTFARKKAISNGVAERRVKRALAAVLRMYASPIAKAVAK